MLPRLPETVERFGYDRGSQKLGIVHFGLGAFHRAHQAWYTDKAMDVGNRDWMIAGVSLRSPAVAAQMNPQDGLYTVVERSAGRSTARVAGSVRKVMVARDSEVLVVGHLAAPVTRIASFTITEKGYCRAADGSLDFALADAGSIYPLLAEGFHRRRAAGIHGLTLLSCDNLAGNGSQLARLMSEYLDRRDPTLRGWFETECSCPSTMIDRIVPATTAADRAAVAEAIGLEDEGAVVTEPFSQWVIEDRFAYGRPAWDAVGADLVTDVAPYETAKLRMLNGAHSALAYLGLAAGHEFVHQAIADPTIRPLVERLIRHEALPTIATAPGQDLGAYVDALLARFANPSLNHRLAQIAMDGSQKIPQRWLETLAARRGEKSPAILKALGAWLRHSRGDNGPVDDPLSEQLAAAWSAEGGEGIVSRLFSNQGIVSNVWIPSEEEAESLKRSISD